MLDNSYNFQDLINPESADRVDCAITTAEGFIKLIDSKFYVKQYQNYRPLEMTMIVIGFKRLRTAILREQRIFYKIYLQNKTTNYNFVYSLRETD